MAYFEIPGKPQGKARARTLKSGHTYTPEKTVLYENLIKQSFTSVADNETYFDGEPLTVRICACFEIPKSTTKKDRELIELGKLCPTKKPDADNIAKVICDALNGIAYKDDSQVVQLNVSKHYTLKQPRVEVSINEIE